MTKEELRRRIYRLGLTVPEFGELARIPHRTIYSYVAGERRIPDHLELIVQRFEEEKNALEREQRKRDNPKETDQ